MSLPTNVRRLRITDGHSIEEVADATNVPRAIIAAIENGRVNVPPKVVRALARHFDVPEDELTK